MIRWLVSAEGMALLALVALGALAAGWLPAPTPELERLAGSGGVSFGLLWACGVCVGRGALLLSYGGMTGLVGWLAVAANLGKISACVGACVGALAV